MNEGKASWNTVTGIRWDMIIILIIINSLYFVPTWCSPSTTKVSEWA